MKPEAVPTNFTQSELDLWTKVLEIRLEGAADEVFQAIEAADEVIRAIRTRTAKS